MRVDDWGLLVVVGVIGLSWEVVGGDCFGGFRLAILERYLSVLIFIGKIYV